MICVEEDIAVEECVLVENDFADSLVALVSGSRKRKCVSCGD